MKDDGTSGACRRHQREREGGEIREHLIVNVRRRWEDNIKMGVKEVWSVSVST